VSGTYPYTLAAVAAGTDWTEELFEVPVGELDSAVFRIHLIPAATASAQGATNFATLTVTQFRAGSSVAALGTLSLGATALVKEVPVDFTLASADQQVQTGDTFELEVTHTGTGGVLAVGAVLEVELQ
jgi:hypothetical protein